MAALLLFRVLSVVYLVIMKGMNLIVLMNFLGQKCSNKEFTFSFLIDGTGSLGKTEWKLEKEFTARLVSRVMTLNEPTISLYQYSTRQKLEVQCGDFIGNTLSLLQHIRTLKQIKDATKIGDAVHQAAKYTRSTTACHRNRTNLNKVMFVTTDGKDASAKSKDLYTQAKNDGFTIYAIGVGSDVDKSELLHLASSSRKRILVPQFDHLNEAVVLNVYSELRFDCGKFLFGCGTFSWRCGTKISWDVTVMSLCYLFQEQVLIFQDIFLNMDFCKFIHL